MLKSTELALRFVLDIVLGVFGFVVLGLAALGLGLFVRWLEGFHLFPEWIVSTLSVLEYLVFVVDAVGFCFHTLMSLSKLVTAIWRDRHDP